MQSDGQEYQHYIKNNYDFMAFCNSKYASLNQNMLSRIQNTFAVALNQTKKGDILPRYVIVVLDDDLIMYLDFKKDGAATLLRTWVQWIVKGFNRLLDIRRKQLPSKCVKTNTFFYWVTAPIHSHFTKERNNLRMKFNLSLDAVIRTQHNMQVLRLKEFWNTGDTSLEVHDKLTETGLSAYWDAIDATFKFNEVKHEVYLAKKAWQKEQNAAEGKTTHAGDAVEVRTDPMYSFFKKHRLHDTAGQSRSFHDMAS